MITVNTPDGRQTIFNDRDAIDIARTYISDDYAEYIGDKIVEFDEAEWRNAQEWTSDYRAMEMENEEYRTYLDEVNSRLQQISYDMDKMTKAKVQEEIDKVWKYIAEIL